MTNEVREFQRPQSEALESQTDLTSGLPRGGDATARNDGESAENGAKKAEKKAKKPTQMLKIKAIKYIGDEPYSYRDLDGRVYTFEKNEVFYIAEGNVANYMLYKRQLFVEADK